MSDARAIEAVTETLRSIIDIGVKEVEAGAVVVTRPPDEVSSTGNELQVNLFLYQTDIDGSLRNESPADLRPAETGYPALPLVLHYLVTPYVRDGNDIEAHRLLGAAMRILHDRPVLTQRDLADGAPYSDVSRQVERIRITWQPLGEKDIYSLWSAFQTQYRLSAAYEVRVVLIDSRRPSLTPLPVLRRGPDDRSPQVVPYVAVPFPMLTGAVPVSGQQAALPGEDALISGGNLVATAVAVRLVHPLLGTIGDITPGEAGGTAVRFTVPDQPAGVPAGLWSVSLALTDAGQPERVTNGVPLAIAPRITSPMPMNVARNGAGTAAVAVTCAPDLQPGQRVFLLLGERAMAAAPVPAVTGAIQFQVQNAQPGSYLTRLRVDGVDSLLIDLSVAPPAFDATQVVTVT
jgi:hypothetical protein